MYIRSTRDISPRIYIYISSKKHFCKCFVHMSIRQSDDLYVNILLKNTILHLQTSNNNFDATSISKGVILIFILNIKTVLPKQN